MDKQYFLEEHIMPLLNVVPCEVCHMSTSSADQVYEFDVGLSKQLYVFIFCPINFSPYHCMKDYYEHEIIFYIIIS